MNVIEPTINQSSIWIITLIFGTHNIKYAGTSLQDGCNAKTCAGEDLENLNIRVSSGTEAGANAKYIG